MKFVARPQKSFQTQDENHSNDQNDVSNNSVQFVDFRCSADGQVEYFNNLANDFGNYEQGKITVSKINPWTLQLCKKQTEKLHRQFLGDENGNVSQSSFEMSFCH